jgi:putative ubiquitin-RnfH superfamily antitoxin RatB of RatAB toxin-antitoxin module
MPFVPGQMLFMPNNSVTPDTLMIPVQLSYSIPGQAPVLLDLYANADCTLSQFFLSLEPKLLGQLQTMLDECAAIAIFGKKKAGDFVLSPGDRIEICRPLIAEPMDARRRRAKRENKSGKM